MRKVILSMQITLDGYIEGPNGDHSWLRPNDAENWHDLFNMLQSVDLLLLGSVMYPDYRDYWKKSLTSPDATEYERKYAHYAERTQHIVFSKSMKDPEWSNTKISDAGVITEVEKLKTMEGRNIQIVGGAKLASSLIDAGLVDEYRLVLNPDIVGGGKSFLHELKRKRALKLIKSKTLNSGLVILEYKAAQSTL